ncbi:MAG: class I SAM-dependent methyltransferase [Candidatus Nanopelagicales bacterium]
MTENPRGDLVAEQYRKWQYPEPIQNLETWTSNNWDWFDPRYAHRMFWPDRPHQADIDILIAGCGTNQAPTIAYNNRASKVVGIDISQESLDHGEYLKAKHGLTNLELRLLPIEEVGALNQDFDLIISSGVLHHMASPQTGMNSLAGVLRPEGVAAMMLYARYGRIGVEIMQAAFREMGLRQDDESLRLVRAGLDCLEPTHPAKAYMANATDINYDAGLVDTFLHGRDVSFTVQDCLELVDSAGLVFQDWVLKTGYYPETLASADNEFLAAISRLPRQQMWSVMERLRTLNGCHLFTASRPERPSESYRVDFSSADAPSYVPLWRNRAGIDEHGAYRHGWRIPLAPTHLALARLVDGERSISRIASTLADSEGIAGPDHEIGDMALKLIEQLWRLDFIAVDLSATTCR